ncbi:MAG: BMP family ABC transporter substrate-binding protein [Candidatus Marinimicrobia bacterium]|nr:BMP family ABC transporter substrate-binding protein [Candidatus Neomarinimicrobiota bacterium]
MKHRLLLFVITLLTICPMTSCDNKSDEKPLKVVFFVHGVLGDQSFFDSAQRGLDKAEDELGIESKTIEAGPDDTQWEAALTDAANDEDYDILIAGSYQMNTFLQQVAPRHPDKKFIIFDAPVDYDTYDCENVYSIVYKQNEGSYLAGVYAAAMTTQKIDGINSQAIIGCIGAQEIPVILDFILGYEQGAKDTNPNIQIIRSFADGWSNPTLGKQIALTQYNQGADIIFQIAGGTGEGVFEAAVEDTHFALGVDSDQALAIESTDPAQAAHILTSMMKNIDNSLYRAIKLHLEGNLTYGQIDSLGIAEGGIGIARNKYYEAITPSAVKALVDATEEKILNGEIVVQTAF